MKETDALDVIIAIYKDSVQEEIRNAIRLEYMELLKADAEARRRKAAADLNQLCKLRIALIKFEHTYNKLIKTTGNINEIDNMIASVKHEIKVISHRKNKGLY